MRTSNSLVVGEVRTRFLMAGTPISLTGKIKVPKGKDEVKGQGEGGRRKEGRRGREREEQGKYLPLGIVTLSLYNSNTVPQI